MHTNDEVQAGKEQAKTRIKDEPSCRTIRPTPCAKPRKRGTASRVWSWMNFTFNVSIGVTASSASHTPAPRPHMKRACGVSTPRSSHECFLNSSNEPNLLQVKLVVKITICVRVGGSECVSSDKTIPDSRLRDGEIKKNAKAAIKASNAIASNSLLDAIYRALVFTNKSHSLIELHLRFDIFGWKSNENLNSTSETSYNTSYYKRKYQT